ncbi:sodium:solute symporter family protein [Fulvivirga sediminis]|uniref:Na+:solute symporter n=1 Tax=Fulvivirga sediminis TaxID=2803949 RepID=A0A937F872_9BACT|nr:sodium:solute symporter family protein [Fulvivirga sediminis]MBL3656911.1 Na+:solute symporter [Fulvivirga sediminis]
MILETVDWLFIIAFFAVSLFIGIWVARQAGSSVSEFFLSGREMPWWLLGVSMVATTFSADTPNLVTDIVRENGVSGNWEWWAFLLTGMLTVFVYSKLWRRSEVLTDLEFYEMRYSGKTAAFLRGFRAIYLGVFFNVMIMATVCLAAIKIGGVLLDMTPIQTLLIASVVTVIYSSLGGLKGVLITDFVQFIIAMIGSIWASYVIINLPEVGGLSNMLSHEVVSTKLDILPDFTKTETLVPLFIIPLAVQWWSVWYPGAEPGGGGYIAQRMLSAKDEKNAIGATLFFNVAHYALRPWPWILIALASLIVFPNLESIQAAFPNVAPDIIKNDLAYPAMLTYLPHGLLGVVIASLIAAFMSTISTHLNWGSSYLVNDFYKRFINPESSDKALVNVGRISTVVLMILSAILALYLENAIQAFRILLTIGAGTGLIFILRWFWWRINAFTELAGMFISFFMAIYFEFIHERLGFAPLAGWERLIIGVGVTTAAWLLVTFLTRETDMKQLVQFYVKVRPAGPGWTKVKKAVAEEGITITKDKHTLTLEILSVFIGTIAVFSALFATGYFIYGKISIALVLTLISGTGFGWLIYMWKKLSS